MASSIQARRLRFLNKFQIVFGSLARWVLLPLIVFDLVALLAIYLLPDIHPLLAQLRFLRGLDQLSSDYMFVSGLVAALFVLLTLRHLQHLIPATLLRVWDSKIIVGLKADRGLKKAVDKSGLNQAGTNAQSSLATAYEAFKEEYGAWLGSWWQAVIAAGFVLIFVLWLSPHALGLDKDNTWSALLLNIGFLLEILIAIFLGVAAWRLAITGLYIARLGQRFRLALKLEHPDNCGGLSPLGNLCLWNGVILSIGAAFFGGWVAILRSPVAKNLPDVYDTTTFSLVYSVLFAVLTIIVWISFFLPLWSLHRSMLEQEAEIHQKLDHIADKIDTISSAQLTKALKDNQSTQQASQQATELVQLQQLYKQYSNVPTWPINTSIGIKFLVSQAVPLLSLSHLSAPTIAACSSLVTFLFADK